MFDIFTSIKGKRSLVQHLTASLVVVVAISSLAISSVIFTVLYQRSQALFDQRASEALTHLSNSLESYLWHMEEESVVSLCETFSNIDIVSYIKVEDHRGNEICRFGKVTRGETILKEQTVNYDGIEVGKVTLGVTPQQYKRKVYETIWISLLSLLSVVIILGLFTRLVLNRTLRAPLGQLIRRTEAISAGEYSEPTQEESFQEIQLILSKFNEMAEQVRLREHELRVSEEQYRSLFETSMEGIMMIDGDLHIAMVNKVLADMLGFTEDELMGMPAVRVIQEVEADDHQKEMERRRAGLSSRYERRMRCKDGTTLWAMVSSSPRFGDDGEFQGSFAMITDITALRTAQAELKVAYDEMEQRVIQRTDELNKTNRLLTSEIYIRKQTEKEIIKAKEAAEEATMAKSEFLANMSHEIRTPMNAIIGMTHLVKMTELTAAQKDYMTKIDISAKSLLGIINDVLDLSKIEAGMLEVESVEFTLDQVLEQLTTIISPRANEKRLEFLIKVEKDVPSSLEGDSMRLAQILINLCNNAVKFTEQGAVVVSISALEQDDDRAQLRFEIQDEGIGIKPEEMEKLFQPFTQADASTTRKYGGTGLGLNLCKQLTDLLDGKIGVESEFGVGSTFWVELPFNVVQGSTSMTQLPDTIRDKLALVVDDNAASRVILKSMLEQMGLNASLSGSGADALERIRGTVPDLLIVDWRMPGMDGLELAQAILDDETIVPKPPMFMVSAYGNASLMQQVTDMGFKGLLFKPVNQSFLFNLVVETLGKGMVVLNDDKPGLDAHCNLRGARVLLVEDNEINRQVAQEILTSVDLKVVEAVNGQAALDFLAGNQDVDLVLMDIQMPIMDGYEATRKIREQDRFKDLPIVAMTAHAMVADIEQSKAAGMNDHIAKPFDPEDLFKVLSKWIKPGDRSVDDDESCKEEGLSSKSELLPASMEGVDLELGLRRARGNQKLYLNLLVLLDEKYAHAAADIRTALAEGRRKDCVALAHSIKGTTGMLGAMDVFEVAGQLEQALDGDQEDVEDLLDRFEAKLEIVLRGIQALSHGEGDNESLATEGEVADLSELKASLDDLRKPLSQGAPVACRKKSEVIRSLVWPQELRPLIQRMLKFMAEYDFKKGRGVLQELDEALASMEE